MQKLILFPEGELLLAFIGKEEDINYLKLNGKECFYLEVIMKTEKKTGFNRLILIGNGFDLLHGLKTRYSDFVKDYLTYSINSFFINSYYSDELIEISYTDSYKPTPLPSYNLENIFDFFEDFKPRVNNLVKVNFKIKSTFFSLIYKSLNLGWVDIEKIYYSRLIDLYKIIGNDRKQNENVLSMVKRLNADLNVIRELLREYLKKEQEKYIIQNVTKRANLRIAFQNPEEDDFPQNGNWKGKEISKVLFLNFNYTEPNFTDNMLAVNGFDWDVINIHGTLVDEMVFGYGDELDEHYKMIEKLGEDEWLKGFKSFGYLQNHKYNNLLGFIEDTEFQVYVVGHSCGLSDKTLLNQIFEHKNCKNIKVFYHSFEEGGRKGEDTFNDTIYNIARIMDDKVKMRSIISKKTQSLGLKTLHDLAPSK
ncbi:AbiH family protein [Maribellus sp. YY47]|uniref:AbiH family protein n=1 Tax=Maribellus sp. YY47 TaxID=2929486 RepID=UPI002000781E|nr:AbiH family protein [Maribellus sp. YY47]MCK3683358.1 bacteriophage abortive infection AbiH family protein [Maribellus sp. YY47]